MLKTLASCAVHDFLELDHGAKPGDAIDFFIYDTIRIFVLLAIIISIISLIRSYLPPEKTKPILSHKKEFIGNILTVLLGIVMPFCPCPALPLFLRESWP